MSYMKEMYYKREFHIAIDNAFQTLVNKKVYPPM